MIYRVAEKFGINKIKQQSFEELLGDVSEQFK